MLHITFGCMFAGKSKQLVEDARYYRNARVQVISHSLTGKTPFVISRTGDKIPCIKTDDIVLLSHKTHDVYLIDEAQFFRNLVPFVHLCLEANKIVHVYGLVGDFHGRMFGDILRLIPHADTVKQLYARCACGKKALYSHRTSASVNLVDACATYVPRCRRCFNE